MAQRIFKWAVFSLSILIVNLLTTYITDYFLAYKGITSPFKFTFIGMLIIIAIFYPLFTYLDGQAQRISARLLRKGKGIFGRTIGLFLTYFFLLFLLYCIYARLWFHLDVVKYLALQVNIF